MGKYSSDEPQALIVDDVGATRALLRDMLAEMGLNDIIEAENDND